MPRIPAKEFKQIYSRVPRVTVELIVMTKQGIVLSKRAIEPEKGKWHLPGGTIFKGETVTQAVHRVAQEELGIRVSIKKLAGIIEYPNMKNYFGQPIGIAFILSTNQKKFKTDHQASETGVFKTLPKELVKDQKIFLKKVL